MNVGDRILFVDDDGAVRTVFTRTVEREGFCVDVAADSSSALELARQTAYGVIVLDYRMPGMTGLELQDKLKVLLPDASFVLVSGACDLDLALEAINEHGISYVIPKPWVREDLISKLRRALEQSWERSASQRLVATMVQMTEDPQGDEESLAVVSRGSFARALMRILEMREPLTRRHCERATHYARLIGLKLKLDGGLMRDLALAARLHDVGKLVIPASVLSNPASLTEDEWQIVRTHPKAGADIVRDVPGMDRVRDMILQHHERWDGSGYPSGLRGQEICLGARVLGVADAVDAMLSDRPYQRALSLAEVVRQVELGAGVQFAPEAAAAFLSLPLEIPQPPVPREASHAASSQGRFAAAPV